MRIVSANLGHLYYSKIPSYVDRVISEDNSQKEYSLSISKYEIKKDIDLITSVSIEISTREGKDKIFSFRCYVVIKVKLDEGDLKKGESLRPIINHLSIMQSWPIFESKIKILGDFKIESFDLPPQPTIEELEVLLKKKK